MQIEVGDEMLESMSVLILENGNSNCNINTIKKLMLKNVLNPNHISVLNFGSCT